MVLSPMEHGHLWIRSITLMHSLSIFLRHPDYTEAGHVQYRDSPDAVTRGNRVVLAEGPG